LLKDRYASTLIFEISAERVEQVTFEARTNLFALRSEQVMVEAARVEMFDKIPPE
jgi:hypothetical protein